MHPAVGALERVEEKAFDLVVAFHGGHEGTMAQRFELTVTGFVQALVAQGFAIAAAIGDAQAAVSPQTVSSRKAMRGLNVSIIGMGVNGGDTRYFFKLFNFRIVAAQ